MRNIGLIQRLLQIRILHLLRIAELGDEDNRALGTVIKRQLREAYRLQKELLQPLTGGLDIAFLWTSDEQLPTERVFQKMQTLLQRIHESVSADS